MEERGPVAKERLGIGDKVTVQLFFSASVLMEVMKQFGDLEPAIAEKQPGDCPTLGNPMDDFSRVTPPHPPPARKGFGRYGHIYEGLPRAAVPRGEEPPRGHRASSPNAAIARDGEEVPRIQKYQK